MPHLIWTPGAAADVRRLYRFLLVKNPDAACRAATAIRVYIKILAKQPQIGRPVEDMPEQYRKWMIVFGDSGYVARYRIDADKVTILAVRHQAEVGY